MSAREPGSKQGQKDTIGCCVQAGESGVCRVQVGQEKEAGLAETRQGGRKVFQVASGRG